MILEHVWQRNILANGLTKLQVRRFAKHEAFSRQTPMLTHAKLAAEIGNLHEAEKVTFSGRKLTSIDDLSVCPNLKVLDVSGNLITDIDVSRVVSIFLF